MRHKYRYRIINKIIKNTCIFPPKCYIIYINKEKILFIKVIGLLVVAPAKNISGVGLLVRGCEGK